MFGASYIPEHAADWIHTKEALIVASVFAAVSIIISVVHIGQHLYHYTMPGIQIYVIRILVICPVYAVSSAVALGLGSNGAYAEIARDVYEAFVIYSFLNLILEYCGGETDCIYQIENEPQLRMPCPLCFMKPRPRDARLMRLCHRGVLQFIIVKPFVAITDIIMIATGNYYKLPYQIFEGIVYNISYAWALYCMFVFYLATSKLIKKFRPVMKFATVKAIVFATYYQSLGVKASSMSPENSYMWNDFILCIEMVVFAGLLMCAFPTSEFQGGIPDSRFMDNVKSVLSVRDVVQDVYHNFMPVYHDYALQRSEKEGPEVVRMKTYLAGNLDSVAIEMSHRYRGRNKRLAFNSLLRGDTPIRARPRGYRRPSDCLDDSSSVCSSASGTGSDTLSQGALSDELGDNSDHSDAGLIASGSRCSSGDLEDGGLGLSSHSGIGIVVGKHGVGMREASHFPSEDEGVINTHFMKKQATSETTNPLRVPLSLNPSASVLPRIAKKVPVKADETTTSPPREEEEVENEIIPPLPRPADRSAATPPRAKAIPPPAVRIPPPSHRATILSSSEDPGPYTHPPHMHSADGGWEANWDSIDASEHWGEFVKSDADGGGAGSPTDQTEVAENHLPFKEADEEAEPTSPEDTSPSATATATGDDDDDDDGGEGVDGGGGGGVHEKEEESVVREEHTKDRENSPEVECGAVTAAVEVVGPIEDSVPESTTEDGVDACAVHGDGEVNTDAKDGADATVDSKSSNCEGRSSDGEAGTEDEKAAAGGAEEAAGREAANDGDAAPESSQQEPEAGTVVDVEGGGEGDVEGEKFFFGVGTRRTFSRMVDANSSPPSTPPSPAASSSGPEIREEECIDRQNRRHDDGSSEVADMRE